jgi:putative FmdB family regulatory protein
MPIYEYSCRKCGEVIEKIQKFSDAPLRRHAGCGGSLAKLVSQSSFQLKGSGWYVTDYAGKGKSEEKAESPADSGGEKAAEKGASDDTGASKSNGEKSTGKKPSKETGSSKAKTPKAG